MRINTNILSLSAQRSLAKTTKAIARAMERLATGRRINSAKDDAAGLAVSNGLQAQRRGLLQAIQNINQSAGWIDTAFGVMTEMSQLVHRIRELAVQSANGAQGLSSRELLDIEAQELLTEFERLALQTEFNGVQLLDGSFGTKRIQVGSQSRQAIDLTMTDFNLSKVFTSTETVTADESIEGDGSFQSRQDLGGAFQATWFGDVNNDGSLDYITPSTLLTSFRVFTNASGVFSQTATFVIDGSGSTKGSLVDINGDTNLDMIVGQGSSIGIYLGNGNGTFQSAVTLATGGTASEVSSADINEDGYADIIVSGSSQYDIYLNNGNGTFQARRTLNSIAGTTSITITDLNGDEHLDIVGTGQFNQVIVYNLGNGDGSFLATSTLSAGAGPNSSTASDFNEDGNIDLAWTDATDGTISIRLGNGNGTFQARTTIQAGSSTGSLVSGDMNGDGHIDLLSRNFGNTSININFGNGNGTFQSTTTLSTSGSPYQVKLLDLDGDEVDDIVVTDSSVGIYYANTTTIPASSVTTTLPYSISLETQEDAEDALEVLDGALNYISAARANLGALYNRLQYAESANLSSVEALSASTSQMVDADLANEISELIKAQLIQSSVVAVLSQANLSQQLVMELLK